MIAFFFFSFHNNYMARPLRVMLDTSVYDLLATIERELVLKIIASNNVRVYGCKAVRNELRKTPGHKKIGKRKLRIQMLNTYDLLVGRHDLSISDLAHYLARDYIKSYEGGVSRDKIFKDFLIVAVASLKNLDIVCTNDNKTMASRHAKKAYQKVNENNDIRTPQFIELDYLKKLV